MDALHSPVPGEGGDGNVYPWKCALLCPRSNGEILGCCVNKAVQ